MKKIHIIYNPNAGKNHRLEGLALALLQRGMAVSLFVTGKSGDAEEEAFRQTERQEVDALISFGGDGTLNEIVNGIMRSSNQLPVAVFRGGTVNDFAKYLDMPIDSGEFADLIANFTVYPTDLGKINHRYFINVFSCGVVSNVAHKTDRQLKSMLGSLAYYIEGVKELSVQGLSGRHIFVQGENYLYNGEYVLFLITNSTSTGGFSKMSPKATIHDGVLNCLMIKKAPITDIFDIVTKVTQGKHISNDYVVYFETKKIHIETDDELDVDGELFEKGPVDIEVVPGKLLMIY